MSSCVKNLEAPSISECFSMISLPVLIMLKVQHKAIYTLKTNLFKGRELFSGYLKGKAAGEVFCAGLITKSVFKYLYFIEEKK